MTDAILAFPEAAAADMVVVGGLVVVVAFAGGSECVGSDAGVELQLQRNQNEDCEQSCTTVLTRILTPLASLSNAFPIVRMARVCDPTVGVVCCCALMRAQDPRSPASLYLLTTNNSVRKIRTRLTSNNVTHTCYVIVSHQFRLHCDHFPCFCRCNGNCVRVQFVRGRSCFVAH